MLGLLVGGTVVTSFVVASKFESGWAIVLTVFACVLVGAVLSVRYGEPFLYAAARWIGKIGV